MNPVVFIEARTPEDWEASRRLLRLYRDYAEGLGIPPFPHETFETYLSQLPADFSAPNGKFLLVRQGNEWVGCAGYHQLEPGLAEIKRMFLLEPARGRGTGHRLMAEIMSCIRRDGFQTVRLDTHPTMQPALRLYRRFGFREIPRYNDHPLPEIIFMECPVSPELSW